MFAAPTTCSRTAKWSCATARSSRKPGAATHVVRPDFDRASIERDLSDYFDRYLGMRMEHFRFSEAELADQNRCRSIVQPCRKSDRS